VNAFRHGFLGASDVDPAVAFVIMGAFAVTMYAIVVLLMNRGTGIRE
jgi:ABC-2 type transport system permease protein